MHAYPAQHLRYNHFVNAMGKLSSPLLLAIAAGAVVAFPSAVEAGSSSHIMSVRALVSPAVVMKFEASAMRLSVTEDDIARGYIDVPGNYRLTVNTDKILQQIANVMVDYEPNPYKFTSIQIATRALQPGEPGFDYMRPANVQFASRTPQSDEPRSDAMVANYIDTLPATAAGPSVGLRKPTTGDRSATTFDGAEFVSVRGSVTSLGYRLMLPGKMKPGNISVPLTLSLQL
jgi:hypothetical protein